MLIWKQAPKASKAIFIWAVVAVVLQVVVATLRIGYDSSYGFLWWFSAFLSFLAHVVIEGAGEIGLNLRGFWGYLATTIVLAVFAIVTVGVIRDARKV